MLCRAGASEMRKREKHSEHFFFRNNRLVNLSEGTHEVRTVYRAMAEWLRKGHDRMLGYEGVKINPAYYS